MSIDIDVADDGWHVLAGLEDTAHRALSAGLLALGKSETDCEVSVLFTDDSSIAGINAQWRGKATPTNVLSFPAEGMPLPPGEPKPLGDIVLALGVITREAAEQGKTLQDHTTHLMIHGLLHLLGFDHETDAEAEEMEAREAQILKGLGISNPYD